MVPEADACFGLDAEEAAVLPPALESAERSNSFPSAAAPRRLGHPSAEHYLAVGIEALRAVLGEAMLVPEGWRCSRASPGSAKRGWPKRRSGELAKRVLWGCGVAAVGPEAAARRPRGPTPGAGSSTRHPLPHAGHSRRRSRDSRDQRTDRR